MSETLYRERERQTDRQTHRQTDRQTDRQTEKERHRQRTLVVIFVSDCCLIFSHISAVLMDVRVLWHPSWLLR